MQYELDYYDGIKLSASFKEVGGETYLVVGPDEIIFHVQVPDYEGESNVARESLPHEFKTKAAARAVAERAHVDGHLSRDGSEPENRSPFPQFSASFNTENIAVYDGRRSHALWARRVEGLPIPKAA